MSHRSVWVGNRCDLARSVPAVVVESSSAGWYHQRRRRRGWRCLRWYYQTNRPSFIAETPCSPPTEISARQAFTVAGQPRDF